MKNKYFDNGATSYPKPKELGEAMLDFVNNIGRNYGRTYGELNLSVSKTVYETRQLIADLLNVDSGDNIFFAANATTAINTILQSYLREGDHVLISQLEHHAVTRCLHHLIEEKRLVLNFCILLKMEHLTLSQ